MRNRRQFLTTLVISATALGGLAAGYALRNREGKPMLTIYTFGDSILDCGHYNPQGVHPGQLLVRNDNQLFPAFRGQDLSSHRPARLVHRAQDGATVDRLPTQAADLPPNRDALVMLTVGGNDLLRGLIHDQGSGLLTFQTRLGDFLQRLPMGPVLIGNVYDPTFGDDSRNFLGIDPALARANHKRMNNILADLATQHGALVDLHAHFLQGDPSWFSHTIEPSLAGASEVRRCFLQVARTFL